MKNGILIAEYLGFKRFNHEKHEKENLLMQI